MATPLPPVPSLPAAAFPPTSSSSSSSRSGWLYSSLPPMLLHLAKALWPRAPVYLPFSDFLKHAQEGKLASVLMSQDKFEVQMKVAGAASGAAAVTYHTSVVPHLDRQWVVELLAKHGVKFGAGAPSWGRRVVTLLLTLAPFLYLALVYRMMNKLYNPTDSIGKEQKGTKQNQRKRLVTFKDVAGIDAAKLELVEVVNFLRDRTRYDAIGARLPKGILLSGAPGTGKTLLARAVANEAGVSFISCSASDFVELLVGRGAARVRDLFQRGFSNAPCIIFIDELDALAKARGSFSSNDEREQTLNQLLCEMDGFEGGENCVLVIAATNRPEVLDSALIRPGRFDRHIAVGLPDTRGRRAILDVHSRHISLAPGIDFARIANRSKGFSGAELSNVVNEAALLAVRAGLGAVTQACFEEALERNNQTRRLAAQLDGSGSGSSGSLLHQLHHHLNNNNNNNNRPRSPHEPSS